MNIEAVVLILSILAAVAYASYREGRKDERAGAKDWLKRLVDWLAKNELAWIKDIDSAPDALAEQIHKDPVFGLIMPRGWELCSLMVIEPNGTFHRWNVCMDCGKKVEGLMLKDVVNGRVQRVCEECGHKRLKNEIKGVD